MCAETCVNLEWPTKLKIPVFVKVTCKSLSAKARFHYSSIDKEDCWVQWIGKPIFRVEIEPRIGLNYDLKSLFPRIKLLFEEFI